VGCFGTVLWGVLGQCRLTSCAQACVKYPEWAYGRSEERTRLNPPGNRFRHGIQRSMLVFTAIVTLVFSSQSLAQLPAQLTTQELLPPGSAGVNRTVEPVTVGIPLADSQGISSSTPQLGLTGASVGQFRCIARWPSGNCKWVVVGYQSSLAANGTDATVALTTGGGNFGRGVNLAADSNVSNPNSGIITVNTGSGGCTFTIQKASYDGLHTVVCNSKTIISNGTTGLILMGPAFGASTCTFNSNCTTAYKSSNDSVSTCSIEENGPVRAAIVCSGGLKDGSGNKYMGFKVRLHFFANQERVKMVVTLKNADDGASGSFPISYKGYQSFKLSLATNLTGSNTWVIGDDGTTNGSCTSAGYCTGTLSAGQSAYVYQGYSTQNLDTASGESYNSSLQFNTQAQADTAVEVTRSCSGSCAYAQDGYLIVGSGGSVIFSGASSVVPSTPMGWADVKDATGGQGITLGTDYMQGNFSKSLEIRNGGQEIDVGISPDQFLWPKGNCGAPTPCQKVYYQPWPEYKVANVDLIFHDSDTNAYSESAVTRAQNDFQRMQYPLVARAPVAYYNAARVFTYPLVDPVASDVYFNTLAAPYGKSFTALTDVPFLITRWWSWNQGGNGNQHDLRYGDLVHRWLERGMPGRYLHSVWFDRFQEQYAWPRADNITCTVGGTNYHGWACHLPTTDLNNAQNNAPGQCANGPASNACNDSSGMLPNNCVHGSGCTGGYTDPVTNENSAGRHYHWWSAIYDYYLTGDEDVNDMLKDGVTNDYTAIGAADNYTSVTGNGNVATTPQWNRSWQASGPNNRLVASGSFGGRLNSAAHFWRYLSDTGQRQDANFVDIHIRNLLTVMYQEPCATTGTGSLNQNWPSGCTPTYDGSSTGQESRGFSAYRGLFIGAGDQNNVVRAVPASGQNVSSNGFGTTPGPYVRSIEPFMQGYLIDAIQATTQLEGPNWSDYQKLFDLGYGAAINVDASNYLSNLANSPYPSPSELVYTMAFDQPNNLSWQNPASGGDANGLGPPFTPIYSIWGQYTGDAATWRSHWENTFINRASAATYTTNNMPDYGSQLTDEVVSLILNPPTTKLNTVALSAVSSGGGCTTTCTWTVTWTPPTGVTKYFLKEHDSKAIVDNIGWSSSTNQPVGDPANTRNWFAQGTDQPAYTDSQPAVGVTTIKIIAPSTAKFMLKALTGGTGGVATLGVAPVGLNFAGLTVGTTSAPQAVILTNPVGNASAIIIDGISVNGVFSQANNCGTLPASLAAGSSCTINVTFAPQQTGQSTGTLTIAHNARNGPSTTVSLSGTASSQGVVTLGVAPVGLNFAGLTVGTTSAPQAVILTNPVGNASTITIGGISVNGVFSQANNCGTLPVSLAVGSSCTINVTFAPQQTGQSTGTLTIAHNARNGPSTTVSLSGTVSSQGGGGLSWKQTWGQQQNLRTNASPATLATQNLVPGPPPNIVPSYVQPIQWASQSGMVVIPGVGPFGWEYYHGDINVFSNAFFVYAWQNGVYGAYPHGQPLAYCNTILDSSNANGPVGNQHFVLASAIDASQTTIPTSVANESLTKPLLADDISYPGQSPFRGPVYIQIEDEFLEVTHIDTSTGIMTVVRGALGSTPAAHKNTNPGSMSLTTGRFGYTCEHAYTGNGTALPSPITQAYPGPMIPPTQHPFQGLVYDSDDDVVFITGALNESMRHTHMYAYCHQTATGWCSGKSNWSFVTSTYQPSADQALVYDPDEKVVARVGGQTAKSQVLLFCTVANAAVGCPVANKWSAISSSDSTSTFTDVNGVTLPATQYISNPTDGPTYTAMKGVYDRTHHAFLFLGGAVSTTGWNPPLNSSLFVLKWGADGKWAWYNPSEVASNGSACVFGIITSTAGLTNGSTQTCPTPDARPNVAWDSKRNVVWYLSPEDNTGNGTSCSPAPTGAAPKTFKGYWDGNLPGTFTWTDSGRPGPTFQECGANANPSFTQVSLEYSYMDYWADHDALIAIGAGVHNSLSSWELSLGGSSPVTSFVPGSLSFGNQVVNTSSAPQTITLTNSGNVALTITSITAPTGFAQSNNCPISPRTLSTGGSCTVNVTFTPTAAQAYSGNLVFADNAGSGTQNVQVSGNRVAANAPVASLTPSSLIFNPQPVGTTSAAQTVTLSNIGSAALTVTSVALKTVGNAATITTGGISVNGVFSEANNCGTLPVSLAVGSSCTINVTFAPQQTGQSTGTLTIAHNARNGPSTTVSLSGTASSQGVVTLGVAPVGLNFAGLTVGTTSAPQAVILTNPVGNASTITIGGISVNGVFSQANNCGTLPVSLAVGSSCTINVTFAPQQTGQSTGTLTIAHNARNGPSTTVSLSGTASSQGVATLRVAPVGLNFAGLTVGTTSAPQAVILTNPVGNASTITIGGISVNGVFSQANNCGTLPVSLAVGSSCTINVTFAPQQTGQSTGTLTIAHNAKNGPSTTVSLSGTVSSQGSSIPIPLNAWTTFQTNGFPAEVIGYDAAVYASAIQRHIVLGKYHHYSSEPNYCMDGWSWEKNRWDILDCGEYPAGGAFVYMPSRNSILYWGSQIGSNQPEIANHTWWWDVVGHVGRDKLGTGQRPGNIKVSSMTYDESRNLALFYPDAKFQLETYDPNSNTWSTPTVNGTAPYRPLTFPTLEWNSTDHKTYIFGGATGNNCNSGTLIFSNDVYTFDPGTNTWAMLTVSPDPIDGFPAARWYAGFAYDPVDNIFLLAGGQNCNGIDQRGLTDTWNLDMNATPAQWRRLNPKSNFIPRNVRGAPFQKLEYDTDHNAFVMIIPSFDNHSFSDGTWGNYPARVWVYCYAGSCQSVGTQSSMYPVPSGSLNRNAQPVTTTNQTWATDTAASAHDGTLYAGWIETGTPFSKSNCHFHHPYVQSSINGASWSLLGSDCTAMDTNAATMEPDGEKLSLAVVNGTVWASWSESNNAAAMPNALFAKYWNGTTWVGGAIGIRNGVGKAFQGLSQLAAVGTKPSIAFIEDNKAVFPDVGEAYVDQFDGTSWQPLGGKLNVNGATNTGRVESIGIASDGSNPWVCWTEHVIAVSATNEKPGWSYAHPAQLYCAHWNGSTWAISASLNQNNGNWAAEASLTYANGRPYVAWTERSTAGNAQLFVKTWNGSAWSLVGGALNKSIGTGWVFHPRMATDGQNIYLSWEEAVTPTPTAAGQPSRLYVSELSGSSWIALGNYALNVDQTNGTAAHSSIAVMDNSPVVIWSEVQTGQLQQTYAKKWNGLSWTLLTGPNP